MVGGKSFMVSLPILKVFNLDSLLNIIDMLLDVLVAI